MNYYFVWDDIWLGSTFKLGKAYSVDKWDIYTLQLICEAIYKLPISGNMKILLIRRPSIKLDRP